MEATRTTVTIVVNEPHRPDAPATHDPGNVDDLVWLAEHGTVTIDTRRVDLPER